MSTQNPMSRQLQFLLIYWPTYQTSIQFLILSSNIFVHFGFRSWTKSFVGTIRSREQTIQPKLITISYKRHSKSNILINFQVICFFLVTSIQQPEQHLIFIRDTQLTVQLFFLRFNGIDSQLNLRVQKQRKLDTKLMNAKDKLITFINSLSEHQIMPMEYLLRLV